MGDTYRTDTAWSFIATVELQIASFSLTEKEQMKNQSKVMKRGKWVFSEIIVTLSRPRGKATHLSLNLDLGKASAPCPEDAPKHCYSALFSLPVSFFASLLVSLNLSRRRANLLKRCVMSGLGDLQPSHHPDKMAGWRQQGPRGHSPYQIVQFSKWPVAG